MEPFQPSVLPQATQNQILLSRIQVPTDEAHPDGQAVTMQIYTIIGGPFFFMFPLANAISLGQGLIETAEKASGIILPSAEDWKNLEGLI